MRGGLTEIGPSLHSTQGIIDTKCLPSLHLLWIHLSLLFWRYIRCEPERMNLMAEIMLIGIFEVWDLILVSLIPLRLKRIDSPIPESASCYSGMIFQG
jgi:hypothetical protein